MIHENCSCGKPMFFQIVFKITKDNELVNEVK